eukprot:TRINITY_DN2425_c1_g2_i1.p1 TRINITY_DN2425_c1_g2~~TRINITY_DN2425_c1_g2_i1.p1  ORF type:complete len:219 (-),score=41.93 TRINITY_DN2425_c1_g2_i1:50-706(-)
MADLWSWLVGGDGADASAASPSPGGFEAAPPPQLRAPAAFAASPRSGTAMSRQVPAQGFKPKTASVPGAAPPRRPRESCICGVSPEDLCGEEVVEDLVYVRSYNFTEPPQDHPSGPPVLTPAFPAQVPQGRDEIVKELFRAVVRDDAVAVSELLRLGNLDIKRVRNGAGQSLLQVAKERNKTSVRLYLTELAKRSSTSGLAGAASPCEGRYYSAAGGA